MNPRIKELPKASPILALWDIKAGGREMRSAQRAVDSSHGRLREFSGQGNGAGGKAPFYAGKRGGYRGVCPSLRMLPDGGGSGEYQEGAGRHHPSSQRGRVLVLGLGCENCNIPVLMDYIGEYDPERVKFLQCQDCEDEMEAAMELLGQLYEKASGDVRVECARLS